MSNSKQRVLITGTSGGFGHGTAKALAERGHTVFATMRGVAGKNEAKAAALRAWATAGGHALTVLELDVTDDASVASAVAAATTDGALDVLINNAGVGNFGLDEGYAVEQAQAIFDVNVFGVMRMARAVVPHMRAAGNGHIVYVSSGLGRVILPFLAIYTASKFALEAYAESLSVELRPLGIRTSIVEPGAYGTSFFENTFPSQKDVVGEYGPVAESFQAFAGAFAARAQAGELGDPKEVVAALVEQVEATDPPMRRPVGADMKAAVDTVNAVCGQVQQQVFGGLGVG